MTSPPPPYTETLTLNHGPQPPPLPPRQSQNRIPVVESSHNPPPWQPETSQPAEAASNEPPPWHNVTPLHAMSSRDPRSSSQQSLVPAPEEQNTGRRTLLLVYVHGFMGNETSFQSFPAHLHNLLTITMAESHIVHTKIYPRYRSRYALEVARDEFSKWLTPHETQWTDVILLGHSMGGLLSADIALLCTHNIIGVVNFDVPFVGMHPGIVKAGLGSIFNPYTGPEKENRITEEPEKPEKRPSRMNTLFNPRPADPNYNPNFYNDVHLPVRKGWANALHFVNKHSKDLYSAGKGLVKSHLEFGGAMADYSELKARYARIRALEEDDESKRRSANPEIPHPPRIRFVNYYTASTGRPKKPKSMKSPSPSRPTSPSGGLEQSISNTTALRPESLISTHNAQSTVGTVSPRISVELHREDEVVPVSPEEPLSATSPTPLDDDASLRSFPLNHEHDSPSDLPEIPPIPKEPPFVDLAQYPNKAERKAAEKEHTKALKDYQRAVKARNTVIKERSKMEERWQKEKRLQMKDVPKDQLSPVSSNSSNAGSDRFEEALENMHLEPSPQQQHPQNLPQHVETTIDHPHGNYEYSHSVIMSTPDPSNNTTRSRPGLQATSSAASTSSSYPESSHSTNTLTTVPTQDSSSSKSKPPKKQKYKKFCMLPPKDAYGNKDPTWVRIFMKDMDEVVAHTSLFFVSDTYEMLVGDVGARIEEWVRENETARLVRSLAGGGW